MPNRIRVGLLLAVVVLAVATTAGPELVERVARRPPNLLLITVETLRRDHCSLYGYERDTTPFLRELAEESIVFDNAWSHCSWTYPSMACVLSGRMPEETGVWHAGSEPPPDLLQWLPDLQRRGYRVGAATSNRFVGRLTGASDAWDRREAHHAPLAGELLARVLAFTRSGSGEPWCVTSHLFDPHGPYEPPAATSRRWGASAAPRLPIEGLGPKTIKALQPISGGERREILARYDEEILYVDRQLRLLVESLRWDGQWDNTCLILTADHGEAFGEHGSWGHGQPPRPDQTAVPFLIRLPGGRLGGARTDALVGGIDVLPTLLTQAGVPVPEDLPGVNAVSLLEAPRPARVLEQHVVGIDWQDEEQATYKLRSRHRGRICGTTHTVEQLPVTPQDAAPQAGDESVLADLRDLGYL